MWVGGWLGGWLRADPSQSHGNHRAHFQPSQQELDNTEEKMLYDCSLLGAVPGAKT